MVSEIERRAVSKIFRDMANGKFPNFGSPETRCHRCMFYKVVCPLMELDNRVGCLGGWKREVDGWYSDN